MTALALFDADDSPQAAAASKLRLVDVARRIYFTRRQRDRAFGDGPPVFRDHAWDMLLDLFVASAEGRSISACSAAIASCAAQSTGLRCLDYLVERGLVRRVLDPANGRRSVVKMTAKARGMMIEALTSTGDAWLPQSCTGKAYLRGRSNCFLYARSGRIAVGALMSARQPYERLGGPVPAAVAARTAALRANLSLNSNTGTVFFAG